MIAELEIVVVPEVSVVGGTGPPSAAVSAPVDVVPVFVQSSRGDLGTEGLLDFESEGLDVPLAALIDVSVAPTNVGVPGPL